MIGNDVIDLSLAKVQSNWQRPGFLEKQFTENEIELTQRSEHPFLLVWRMWSMKEAVYKVLVQQEQKRFFNPKKLECTIISEVKGSVAYQDQNFETQTITTRKYIYTTTGGSEFQWIGEKTDQKKIAQLFERQTGFPSTQLKIRKDALGIPNLFAKEKRISSSFTKTHHGRFKAIEYILN